MAVAAGDRAGEARLGVDPGVRPQDGALDDGAGGEMAVVADDAVGADAGAGLHDRALADEARRLDRGAVLDAGVGGNHRLPGRVGEGRRTEAAIHDVVVRLHVFLGRADVEPVAARDMRDECLAVLDQRREVAALNREGRVGRNAVEGFRIEHVDAGVDRVADDLVGRRLLEEPQHVAVGVGLDQAVRAGIVHRREDDRGLRLALAVQRDHLRQIDGREHIAVEHDDRLAAGLASRKLDPAAGPERRGLHDVAQVDAQLAAVAEDFLDPARLVVQAEDDLVDFRAPAAAGRSDTAGTADRRSGRWASGCGASGAEAACLCLRPGGSLSLRRNLINYCVHPAPRERCGPERGGWGPPRQIKVGMP